MRLPVNAAHIHCASSLSYGQAVQQHVLLHAQISKTERIRKLPHTAKPCPDAGSLVLGQNQECLGGESEQASFHTLLMQAFVLCVVIGPTLQGANKPCQ